MNSFFDTLKRLHADTCRAYINLRKALPLYPPDSNEVQTLHSRFEEVAASLVTEADRILGSVNEDEVLLRETTEYLESWPMLSLILHCEPEALLAGHDPLVQAIDRRLQFTEPDFDFGRDRI